MNQIKEYQIWENYIDYKDEKRGGGMFIPKDEIYESVWTGDFVWYGIKSIVPEDIQELNEKIKNFEVTDIEELEKFLLEMGYYLEEIIIERLNDYEEVRTLVCYDLNENIFFNLEDCESYPTYEWWDGSNWIIEQAGEDTSITNVVIDETTKRSLDKWDGNNWCTGGRRFYHEDVYQIIELDGEKPKKEMYLVHEWSQWQGTHSTARIMTKEELEEHIEGLKEAR